LLIEKPHRPGLPLFPRFQHQLLNLEPVIGAGAGQFAIGGIAKDNGFTALLPKTVYVIRGIVYINMSANSALIVHKAEVPIGYVIFVQPFYGLGD
jgi:hypothetical protein